MVLIPLARVRRGPRLRSFGRTMDASGCLPRTGHLPFFHFWISSCFDCTSFAPSQHNGNLDCVASSYQGGKRLPSLDKQATGYRYIPDCSPLDSSTFQRPNRNNPSLRCGCGPLHSFSVRSDDLCPRKRGGNHSPHSIDSCLAGYPSV